MTIPFDEAELDALNYVCEVHNLRYYKVPTSKPNLCTVTIKQKDGSDLDNVAGYYLARELKSKIEFDSAWGTAEKFVHQ